ncbi:FecR family protein [Janthinobacterium sp. P210006]|uniref:FecR family protein n=1 Tax=Janthinobacterium sp. P210006 TaxID=3112939 RepID=UPI002E263B0F|nr:FecR domain-containing protein [Janthinobacterium sp. P210006]
MSRGAMHGQRADAIAEQAAHWIVRLSADDPAERDTAQAGYAAWKAADPLHATAAAGMENVLRQLNAVREPAGGDHRPARAALAAIAPRRQRLRQLAAASAVAVLALTSALAVSERPAYLLADLRSPTGQWRTHTLADGSHITLGSGSAVNVHFNAGERHVELVQGDILVDVAKDAQRPFIVDSGQAAIRALGTRFTVRRDDDATILSMLESKVSAQVPQHPANIVQAGQRTRITEDGVGPITAIDAASVQEAWRAHQLVIDDQPLADVLDELARHRPGQLHYDREQIAGIRVAAVLPLDDTDKALQLLIDNFPQLRIRMLTRYLVMVDAPASALAKNK